MLIRSLRQISSRTGAKMPKAKETKKKGTETTKQAVNGPIVKDKSDNVIINVKAKPGAKVTGITDIGEEQVGIQISAPPVDGEANAELLKYISSILGIRKSDVSLERGSRSHQKTIKISSNSLTISEIEEKLRSQINK